MTDATIVYVVLGVVVLVFIWNRLHVGILAVGHEDGVNDDFASSVVQVTVGTPAVSPWFGL